MTVNIQAFAFILRSLIIALILALSGYFLAPQIDPAPGGQIAYTISAIIALTSLLSSVLHWLLMRMGLRSTTLYVGNLAFKTTESELHELFTQYGAINSVRIMKDRITRRPRGYAFVELNAAGAKAAIKDLDGGEFGGRTLKVNVANKRGRQ